MASSDERANGVDYRADGVPDYAGDFLGVSAEDLEVDSRAVGWGDGVCDEAQCDDDGAEFAEVVEWGEALYDQRALALVVCCAVSCIGVYS